MFNKIVSEISKHKHEYLIVLIYFALLSVFIYSHEMYIDETQAWAIARNSNSIKELIQNMHYESNMGTYHFVIYILTKLSNSVYTIQALNLILATSAVFLIVRFSKINEVFKALIPFGYFFIYEYGVFSRFYTLTLLIFIACVIVYIRHSSRKDILAIMLTILSITSVHGALITIPFLFLWLVDDFENFLSNKKFKLNLTPYFTVIFGILVCFYTSLPPSSGNRGTFYDNSAFDMPRLQYTISDIFETYTPLPADSAYKWNTSIFIKDKAIFYGFLYFSILSFVLRNNKKALLFYILGTAFLLIFTYSNFIGLHRHAGHLFIILIGAIMLRGKSHERIGNIIFTTILLIHLFVGFQFAIDDVLREFTPSKTLAKYIDENYLEYHLVGEVFPHSMNTVHYLNSANDIYIPALGNSYSYVHWNKNSKSLSQQEILDDISENFKEDNLPILIITNSKLINVTANISLIKYYGNTITGWNQYLYIMNHRSNI